MTLWKMVEFIVWIKRCCGKKIVGYYVNRRGAKMIVPSKMGVLHTNPDCHTLEANENCTHTESGARIITLRECKVCARSSRSSTRTTTGGDDDLVYITEANLMLALGKPSEDFLPNKVKRADYFASLDKGTVKGRSKGKRNTVVTD